MGLKPEGETVKDGLKGLVSPSQMTEMDESLYRFSDKNLVPFLEEMVLQIKERSLPYDKYQSLFEYYISCKKRETPLEDQEDKELMKFFTLGWWVYENLK